jgi:hypothetical protein
MANNNFKGGPGGRLKAEEDKKTLYVSNPNDPRLQAYQDSLSTFNNLYKFRDEISKIKDNQFSSKKELNEHIENLKKIYPKNYALLSPNPNKNNIYKTIATPDGGIINHANLIATKPQRPVVLMPEPIQPRQSPVTQLSQPQMIAPVMRPVSVPQTTPMEEPMMEEQVVTERPVVRKPPRAVMPTRQGGWGNQPLLMKLFPKLYER